MFFFLAWKECGTLWLIKREFYEETRYDFEKEQLRASRRERLYSYYELATSDMLMVLGSSAEGSLEIPPLPEIKKIPFVAYRIDGVIGRGLSLAISVDRLGKLFALGVNSYLGVKVPSGGKLFLEIEGEVLAKEKENPLRVVTYVVKPGDTLWDISKKFNISIDTIISANELKNLDLLKIGQVLKIPNVSGVFHKVKAGDSLYEIAKLYKADIKEIEKYNIDKDLKTLKVGTLIFVPGGKLPEKPNPSRPRWLASRGTSRTFMWPLRGRITSRFGWRRDPLSRRREFHTGLDIAAERGAYIRASRSGKVVYAGWRSGYGLLIVIDHGGGWETYYAHCSRVNVRKGQYVRRGEVIGRVGSTGRTTGPHLHFEVRKGGRPLNPLYYLR
ncbi:MAG: M23 family metallopeptidase [Synergistetes bacterium]|nr:M23 family metallopeptidase [Synergistota bacterium]